MKLTKEVTYPPVRQDYTIPLVEIFYSVQGEGRHSGRPAVFVRLAGCNLNCVFADGSVCDTPWHKPNLKLTIKEIVARVYNIVESHVDSDSVAPMLILTGGEPTAHPHFDELVFTLHRAGWYIGLETNGTRHRKELRWVDWIVVSPKNLPPIHHPGLPLDSAYPDTRVMEMADEIRYVISGAESPKPPYQDSPRAKEHYVSPALEADGTGTEAQRGITPLFARGAVARCLEIVKEDPRWKISLQTHKWLQVR